MTRQFAHVSRSVNMEWGFMENHVAVIALRKSGKSVTSIYQPTNAHIISHKAILRHFKTLRHVSILSDHHQGALFLVKVMLQFSQFSLYFFNNFSLVFLQMLFSFACWALTINLIVAPCIFVESLQFVHQRMHI